MRLQCLLKICNYIFWWNTKFGDSGTVVIVAGIQYNKMGVQLLSKVQYQKSKDCKKCTGLYLLNKPIEYLLDHWNALRPSQTMQRNYFSPGGFACAPRGGVTMCSWPLLLPSFALLLFFFFSFLLLKDNFLDTQEAGYPESRFLWALIFWPN